MTKNPSQVLKDEHTVIKKMQDIIYAIDLRWNNNPEKYEALVNKLIHFFREYSDRFHHHKEELVLFEEMRRHPDFALVEIIDVLEDHHEMFREYTREISRDLQAKNYERVQATLHKYIHQLLDHIAVEDDELFGMAEQVFSENELERIYFKFQDIDLELGEKVKKELEQYPSDIMKEIDLKLQS
ncbi:MAG TPA: hemerythrin domain-containing protein [Bacteroidia bacterium]|nr:hemerythrin domain-containing protein [Bacteroidia bacterium]